MGVTYKLKEEVVNFILDVKRDSPDISCRQISSLTADKFKIEISKSSVNSIIHRASLSCSVGRRNLYAKFPKKFEIPEEKKSEITEVFQTMQLDEKGNLKALEHKAQDSEASSAGPALVKTVDKALENRNLKLLGVGANLDKEVIVKGPVVKDLDYAAIVLLKMAAQDVLSADFELDEEQEERIIRQWCVEQYALDPQKINRTLKTAQSLFGGAPLRRHWLESSPDLRQHVEVGAVPIKAVKIFLNNGQSFFVNVDDFSVQEDIQKIPAIPYQKCIKEISEKILLNTLPVFLKIAEDISAETKNLVVDMILKWNQVTVEKICFLDEQKNVFFDIKVVPKIRRQGGVFVKGGGEKTNPEGVRQKISPAFFKNEYYFTVHQDQGSQTVCISKDNDYSAGSIILSGHQPFNEQIVFSAITYFEFNESKMKISNWRGFDFDSQKNLEDSCGDLIMERVKQKFFFESLPIDKSQFKQIFSLNGSWEEKGSLIRIKFAMPPEPALRFVLQEASHKANYYLKATDCFKTVWLS
ncbi:MAG: helix-turn-helix domain-containing protein [Candidatus Omnitrophica bacterium]|nr:helix-turn-helix domain-containing protein [Candidatus Omnitrophota bacterium]